MTRILATVLLLLGGVQQLVLANQIVVQSTREATPCPLFCDCFYSNASVVCSMQDGHFPPDLPKDTQSLALRPLSSKIRFLFLHNFFAASSNPTYSFLRHFELSFEKDRDQRAKIRIHQGAFPQTRFPSLENFQLTGGSLQSLSSTFLNDAPPLVSVDLHDNEISSLQPTSFAPIRSSLENLNLSYNLLESVGSETFSSLTMIIRLDLSYNKISSIHYKAFSKMTRLAELYLQGNQLVNLGSLSTVDPSPLIQWPMSLAVLDLSNNKQLHQFPVSMFVTSHRLNTLRLNDLALNMTEQHFSNSLRPLSKSLKNLELNNSTMSKVLITSRPFRGFHFERLSLIGNNLTSLNFLAAPDVLVETLFIDNNRLSCVCLANSTINRSLKYLSATKNQITVMGNDHLQSFPGIRFLNVSMNEINKVNESAFSSLSLLRVLDLSSNKLQELPRTAFLANSFPQVQRQYVSMPSSDPLVVPKLSQVRLRVHNNPFHCNADLLWLKELYDRSMADKMNEEPVNEPHCATPYPPHPFSKLAVSSFKSYHPTSRILNGPKNFTAYEGKPLNLTCEVFGDPSPRVVWKISPDRETIFYPTDVSERRRIVQITLTNVQRINEGMVTCMAVNRIGSHASTSYMTISASKLSWESVVDITLTSFVSCFVAVVIIALIVWACVTRRRRHSRLSRMKGSDDSGSGRTNLSSGGSTGRQPSKSPSTSTGAESLLNFDDKVSSQKHLHKISESGDSNVHAKLLTATERPPSPPPPVYPRGTLSRTHKNGGPTVPLLMLDETTGISEVMSKQHHSNGHNMLTRVTREELDVARMMVNGHKPAPPPPYKPAYFPATIQQQHAKRVKLVSSTLAPKTLVN